MATVAPIPTATSVTLAQWLSPGFPVGAFAYSHGLEAAGVDPDSLQPWLEDLLEHGTGWTDAILIRNATAPEAPDEARARCASAERLLESETLGAAFAGQMREVWGMELPDMPYPVAFGRAVAHHDLPVETAIAMYLHAFAGNLIAAAQRLMPLGQTRAQTILHGLTPLCHSIAKRSNGATLDDITSTCFAADIAAMAHETQTARMFRT